MTRRPSRKALVADLAAAHAANADQERAAQWLLDQLTELRTEMATMATRHERALAAQREEHAAIQRGHLADLADARAESVRDGWALLTRQRDDAIAEAADLRAELDLARDAVKVEAHRAAEAEAEVERLRAWAEEGWRQAIDNADRAGRLAVVTEAAAAVLPDLERGLPHVPHGGSRTRARRRMEALAAAIDNGERT